MFDEITSGIRKSQPTLKVLESPVIQNIAGKKCVYAVIEWKLKHEGQEHTPRRTYYLFEVNGKALYIAMDIDSSIFDFPHPTFSKVLDSVKLP